MWRWDLTTRSGYPRRQRQATSCASSAKERLRTAFHRAHSAESFYMSKRLIIVGAGEAGRMLAREVANRARGQCEMAGFLDDAPVAREAQRWTGFPVLGATAELPAVVRAATAWTKS